MLRVAIIGCGKIADVHAAQIRRIAGSEIIAACDAEPLMARQLCERFAIPQQFSEVAELLRDAKPDVVHVTTPPPSHFPIAMVCLEAGCHVYVEKPFTLTEGDAYAVIALAEQRGLRVTVGHDGQFRHASRRMREIVRTGYLGGAPVHMESYFCYNIDNATYARAVLGDKKHWVRSLPGGLLHNIISHGIAPIAEFMVGDAPRVIASGFASSVMKSIGEANMFDELRVMISEGERVTASFTFSSQMRPSLHQFRLYGPKNGLIADQDQETVIKLPGHRLTSYLEQFVSPVGLAKQYADAACRNVRAFLNRDFHDSAGVYHLTKAFYSSIVSGSAVPIPYREILLTARIMDDIFAQLEHSEDRADAASGRSVVSGQGAILTGR